jgi:hypothetical protein
MAQTNAQNQAAHRQRHLKNGGGTSTRMDIVIDQTAKLALKRMAAHYRMSNRAMLQKLTNDAQAALLATMDSDSQTAYYGAVRAV